MRSRLLADLSLSVEANGSSGMALIAVAQMMLDDRLGPFPNFGRRRVPEEGEERGGFDPEVSESMIGRVFCADPVDQN